MDVLALNSGGIDSPVAMHLLLEHGHDVAAVTFDMQPFTDEAAVETARETVRVLEDIHGTEIPVMVVPHGFVHEQFLEEVDEDVVRYNCLFSRRVMLRTAEQLARDRGYDALLTGESLGQVASQTLDNVVVTGDAVDIPVLRPLIGLDKSEIVAVAKEIGTYDVSTEGGVSCAAQVDYPETHGVIDEIEAIEDRFDIPELVRAGLEQAEP